MSYVTARQSIASRTFYEGELTLKTGRISKTKVFASILKNDMSLYIIDIKKVPRTPTGEIQDRIDPYEGRGKDLMFNTTVLGADDLAPGWRRIDLTQC